MPSVAGLLVQDGGPSASLLRPLRSSGAQAMRGCVSNFLPLITFAPLGAQAVPFTLGQKKILSYN